MLLSATQILAAADLKTEDVAVPEWGGTVRVRGLPAEERDAFEDSLTTERGGVENFRARLVALTVVDENGALVFNPTQALVLGKKSALAIERVFSVAQRLSGMGRAAVEAAVKNSVGDRTESSSSA